ncbi:MAG: NAD(P)H-hydrate epimerase [Bdellovibrionota bacterium]
MQTFLPIWYKEEILKAEHYTMHVLGVPSETLMEIAGYGAFGAFYQQIISDDKKPLVVLAGPGNNGGDGLVFARYALLAGLQVRVCLVGADTMATPVGQKYAELFVCSVAACWAITSKP